MSEKTFAQRYYDIRTRVGGVRERQHSEHTFGPAPEELIYVAQPSKQIVRILAEVNFAIKLNDANAGVFAGEVDTALRELEMALEADGVLTNSSCERAERALMPLASAAKEYSLIYTGHAHIDMNWMWGYQETVAAALSTFRTMLDLMKEYPEYTFMQSQASVYKIVERHDPALMDEIKQRIREGRWEVTANAWVETDKNMPDTESLLHHISVTREYLEKTWDIDPDSLKVDFSPDTFGHSRFIPEINLFEGVKYYYHCRGLKENYVLYRYRAPSGKEVLMYKEPYWYNSAPNPDNGAGIIELSTLCGGLKTGLIVYGVGNHGGGPTRRDIEMVLEMKQWPIFPAIRFGRLSDFFAAAESVTENLPVVEHEVTPAFTGCYTTQSRIKLGNRRSEVSLNDSEKLSALANLTTGAEYPADRFTQAWQNVLFTHFHDILTGSCVQESREYAMGLYADALATTQTAQANAMRAISQNTDTSCFAAEGDTTRSLSEGAGVGYGLTAYAGVPNPERGIGKTRVYTLFNTADTDRDEPVEVTMWDYPGDFRRLEAVDSDGNVLPLEFSSQNKVPEKYWDHWFVKLYVKTKVPALGYATVAIREKELTSYMTNIDVKPRNELPKGGCVLENEFIRAEFDNVSGRLISFVNRKTGKECLSEGAGLSMIETEHATSSAWDIGRYTGIKPVEHTVRFTPGRGELVQTLEIEQKILSSTVKTLVSLAAGSKALEYSFEIDWNERANAQDYVPVLTYRFPVYGGADKLICDIPAGLTERPACAMDYPCQTFAAVKSNGAYMVLAADCKYGYRLSNNILSCTLINTASNPDPYPERGIHKIKLWLAFDGGAAQDIKHITQALMRPITAVPTAIKKAALKNEARLMGFESDSCVLSSVSMDGDKLFVRFYEAAGKEATACVKLPFNIEAADTKGCECVKIEKGSVIVKIGAYSIGEIRLQPGAHEEEV